MEKTKSVRGPLPRNTPSCSLPRYSGNERWTFSPHHHSSAELSSELFKVPRPASMLRSSTGRHVTGLLVSHRRTTPSPGPDQHQALPQRLSVAWHFANMCARGGPTSSHTNTTQYTHVCVRMAADPRAAAAGRSTDERPSSRGSSLSSSCCAVCLYRHGSQQQGELSACI